MNEQDFQVQVVKHLAGELSASESERVLEEVRSSVERQKFFEECRQVWQQTEPSEEIPEIANLEEKWDRFQKVAFAEKKKISLYARLRPMLRMAAAIVLLVGGAMILNLMLKRASPGKEYVVVQSQDLVREVALPDGSVVHLDKGGEIRYEQDFTSRNIELRGKALFEVLHLENNAPFTVVTASTQTTVLGTVFMVNALEEDKEVQIYVKEGRVSFQEIDAPSDAKILTARDEAVYRASARIIEKRAGVVESNQLSWKTGQFKFKDAPLAEILPLIEHYYGVSFDVKNEKLLNCTYNTDFSNVDLLDIINELSFGLNLEIAEIARKQYEIDGTKCN
ncbi:MAG: DUF4974 domain-containing protein [Saprospiraceae bacterium]|nr:DUF4974 domain-containing protein [Saprospiraceae bacterium]